jgi:hypothetical protein
LVARAVSPHLIALPQFKVVTAGDGIVVVGHQVGLAAAAARKSVAGVLEHQGKAITVRARCPGLAAAVVVAGVALEAALLGEPGLLRL